jgi:Bifunctional DNA primase/polymerase, N-terminal/Primase C terminal 2 (PriCT-2)/Family of unknown function (DUF5906)
MTGVEQWDPISNFLHKAVLHYLKMGWRILPIYWMEGERCACGKRHCNSPGKHPIHSVVPHGVKDATLDQNIAIRWWNKYPKANIGIALGRASGIVVVDVDGFTGREQLEELLRLYEYTLDPKLFVETGRVDGGRHYYFRYPLGVSVPNRKLNGLEVKSDGTYVVAPPSTHHTGKPYVWRDIPPGIAMDELPQCFLDFAVQGQKLFARKSRRDGPRGHLQASSQATTTFYSPPAWSEAEEARVVAALQFIPADDYAIWARIGMALHWTTWGDRSRKIWDDWSKRSTKYEEAKQEKTWNSFGRPDYNGPVATLGTLFALAKEHGYVTTSHDLNETEEAKNAVDQINQRQFLIRNIGGKCLVGEMVLNPTGSGQMLSLQTVESFRTWYLNQTLLLAPPGGKVRQVQVGNYWLQHKRRRQYEGVDLVPNEPLELLNGNFNLWRGFGVEPKRGDWSLMMEHVCFVLAAGDINAAEYICKWAAWTLQHPGERAEVALVFQGGKGCGKGVFIRALARCFGEHGMQIFNQEHLVRKFNGHLRSCLFLFVDEGYWAGSKKSESVLKGLITEPALVIEQKGIDPVQWPNRLHVAMAANADWVVPASAGERRYAVFKCADKYVKGHCDDSVREAHFSSLHRELDNGGLEAMLFDMLSWNLGNWHPRMIYETRGLLEQKEQSLSPLEQWLEQLLQEGVLPGPGIFCRNESQRDFSSTRALVDSAKERSPQLHWHLSDKQMGIFLRKHGCIPFKYRNGTLETRGWKFPPFAQMRADWSKRFGGWEWQE